MSPARAGDAGDDADAQSTRLASGLLAKLLAAVRPEFRGEVLTFEPSDPVFGGAVCRVVPCGRLVTSASLCAGHRRRWTAQGRPDLDDFAAAAGPSWTGAQHPSCQVPGCRYGGSARGLCRHHYLVWAGAGRAPLTVWLAAQPPAQPPAQSPSMCLVSSCQLWAQPNLALCDLHSQQWRRCRKSDGSTDIGQFARGCDTNPPDGAALVDLRCLPPQLRLELQYALQCRRDEIKSRTRPMTARMVALFLASTDAGSLLEHDAQWWAQRYAQQMPRGGNSSARALLVYARRVLEDLVCGHGWDVEYPRDVWRVHTLGLAGHHAHLRFDRIPQPWLRALAKRWSRLRLSTGISPDHVYNAVIAITRFALFLSSPQVEVDDLAQIDRMLLERYLAELHTHTVGSYEQGRNIMHLNRFFHAIRRNGWDEGRLPATAMFFPEDCPKPAQQLPRSLADHVMAQVEDPANLDQWKHPHGRLITVILIRCGLRISDGTRLAFDCVVLDSDGAPYLRYYNHKMKREALVPIDEELHQMIRDHQQQLLQRWPNGAFLFPRTRANQDGSRPIDSSTYRRALHPWLETCDIRDDHGRPVHLTPHQWRHTLGTKLINRDVPQEVVRKILDHDSHAMTAHYARLSDTTVRRHWEQATKVNHRGEKVTLDPDGPLAEASWAKQRISRATQALPNGYCGLPLVKTCPHANSCLTCPVFVTTPEFLPQHRQQHQQTLQIITAAEARGQTRLAEMNQQIAGNLERIITTLEADPDQQQTPAADAC